MVTHKHPRKTVLAMETYIVNKWLYTYSNYKSKTLGALHKYTFYLHSDQNIPFQKVHIPFP